MKPTLHPTALARAVAALDAMVRMAKRTRWSRLEDAVVKQLLGSR
ncbi:MAG: hypothetical protein ACXWLM_07520 [Myxococcales bacterium]